MNIIEYPLDQKHWFQEVYEKRFIVWHGTEGRTSFSNGVATSSIEYWAERKNGKGTVAAPWLIDRDGSIYKVFDDMYWANHLGGVNPVFYDSPSEYDRHSVGIEIANELGLKKKENGTMITGFDAEYKGEYFEYSWNDRDDFKTNPIFWASLSDLQIQALIDLTVNICDRFNIPANLYYPSTKYDEQCLANATIICHSNIRSDKTDIIIPDDIITRIANSGINIVG